MTLCHVNWLREGLKIHLLPAGNIGCQIDSTNAPRSPINYRTDKPIFFSKEGDIKGLSSAIEHHQDKAWLHFCYSPLPYYNKNALFFNNVFQKTVVDMPMSEKSHKKLASLILLAALTARSQITGEPLPIQQKAIASLINIKNQTWRAIWVPRWKSLVHEFEVYDSTVVNALAWSLNKKDAS